MLANHFDPDDEELDPLLENHKKHNHLGGAVRDCCDPSKKLEEEM